MKTKRSGDVPKCWAEIREDAGVRGVPVSITIRNKPSVEVVPAGTWEELQKLRRWVEMQHKVDTLAADDEDGCWVPCAGCCESGLPAPMYPRLYIEVGRGCEACNWRGIAMTDAAERPGDDR